MIAPAQDVCLYKQDKLHMVPQSQNPKESHPNCFGIRADLVGAIRGHLRVAQLVDILVLTWDYIYGCYTMVSVEGKAQNLNSASAIVGSILYLR